MPVLYKTNSYADAPKDAVIIPRSEASEIVWDSVHDLGFWKSLPYKGAYASLAFCTGISSMMISGKLRKMFKVGKYGFLSTTIPAAYVPMIGNYLIYKLAVSPSIFLQEKVCPTCLQVKAMGVQLGTGIIYPFVSSYFITYLTAAHLGTIVAPQLKLFTLSSARREMIDIFKKSTSKLVKPMITYSIIHCTLACAVIMLQLYMIDDTLKDVEQKRLDDIDMVRRKEMERRYKEQRYSVLSTTV